MTGDKVAQQLKQVSSAYSQGFADGYRIAEKELITCKDCFFYRHGTCGHPAGMITPDEDDYCSRAMKCIEVDQKEE